MILVLLGTQDKPFLRLLEEIQKLVNEKKITDEVVIQAGHTKFESDNIKIYDFLSREEYERSISEANLIICHGGVSAIFDGLNNNIPVIAVPRLEQYGEHVNDHQIEIVTKFDKNGYIIGCLNLNELASKIKKAKKFKAKKYISTTNKIIDLIEDFIQ